MKCPKCQHENREGAKFCEQCGTRLQSVCPNCGSELRPKARFCDECGTRIAESVSAEVTVSKLEDEHHEALPDAERRQLTVMFCDIVGSTPLAEQLDPEKLRGVLRNYQSVCARVIRRFDGYIARYIGDGILAYFGYPVAHEDDAQRAVRTGLGIVEGIQHLNASIKQNMGTELHVRLGIHTGIVVAGDMDTSEQLESMAVVGETPSLAARLQSLAKPDTILISGATNQLIKGFFHCRSLGARSLEGISQPVEAYQVLHESGARTRLDTVELVGLTPLIGRKQELNLLLDRWEQAKEGIGHVVLLGGEAGIGKSRIVKALKECIAEEPQAWLTECRCSPYHQNTAFYPVVDLFQQVILKFDRGDSHEDKLGKLEGFLVQYGLILDETVPLFATLLSIPLGDSYPPLNLEPKQQKQKTLQILLDVLTKRASQQPVLLVMEDLHWADASSLEFLDLLIDQGPTVPIFTVLTFRPTFVPPWTGRSHLIPMTLDRLTPKQVSDMVEHIAVKALPVQVLEQIVDRTDGVPLFVEELTKMVLESGLLRERERNYELVGPLPPLAIPTTLQDSLMARLDRLAAVKEVANLAATLGREFSYELLHAVSPLDEETLQRSLARLVDAELLYQRGFPPQATYFFKHSLIRDIAYESLLKSRRQQYHQQIAQVLVKQFSEITQTQPEIVAHHYTEAGLDQQAIPYWLEAGQQAAKRSANVEAISHLTHGLELVGTLPETPKRVQQEIALQIALGPVLIASRGYTDPEVEATFTRAQELCQKSGEACKLFLAWWGLFMFYFLRAELQRSYKIGERLLDIAQSLQDQEFLMEAHVILGETLFHMGKFANALEHLEQALTLYEPQRRGSYAFLGLRDSGAHCLNYVAFALWQLGYPDKALERIEEGLKLAVKLDHPYTQAMNLNYYTFIHQLRREEAQARERAESLIELSTEQNFPAWIATASIFQGWAIARQGEIEDGIDKIQQGLSAWQTMGCVLDQPHFYSLLSEASGEAGRTEEGIDFLTAALSMIAETDERYYEAELYRLKGELMLMREGDGAEAEACFHRAIDVARRQQAKSWELRATVSLSRLWQKQGKEGEAQQMLQEIYDWFTEGFDTKDLQEAKTLLEEFHQARGIESN